jgi:hypothetical protein
MIVENGAERRRSRCHSDSDTRSRLRGPASSAPSKAANAAALSSFRDTDRRPRRDSQRRRHRCQTTTRRRAPEHRRAARASRHHTHPIRIGGNRRSDRTTWRVGCAGGDASSLNIDRSPCSREERAQLGEIRNDVRGRRRSRHAWSQNLHRRHAELVSSRDLGVLAVA